jgi:hypothetical protein
MAQIITIFLLFVLVCSVSLFFFYLIYYIKIFTRISCGFIQDLKVDMILEKAVYLGDIASYSENRPEDSRVRYAVEKSCSIVADVMLQNNINPKDYNLTSLVLLRRTLLNLDMPKKEGVN